MSGVNIEKLNGIEIEIDYNKIIEDNSRKVAEQIKNKAKEVLSDKASGVYANSWTYRLERDVGVNKVKGVVLNEDHYQLTFLLENGHDVKKEKNGQVVGHAAPQPHIAPVFEKNKDIFYREMSKAKYEIKEK